jgi:hypothetical protein
VHGEHGAFERIVVGVFTASLGATSQVREIDFARDSDQAGGTLGMYHWMRRVQEEGEGRLSNTKQH